jgi:hypothetical protein
MEPMIAETIVGKGTRNENPRGEHHGQRHLVVADRGPYSYYHPARAHIPSLSFRTEFFALSIFDPDHRLAAASL